jgi:GNAT superfamily N-acetyltransferase
MEIRAMTAADLPRVLDIDATIESPQHLHILRQGEGFNSSWKLDPRRLRQPRVHRNALSDDTAFAIKQIVGGIDEGIALVVEHKDEITASAAARLDAAGKVLRLIDLRVDFEYRREGLASGLLFQLIQEARQKEFRAVATATLSDNFPAAELLGKLNFELTGFDTHFNSNHDLLNDSVILFWYLQLN